MYDSYFIYPPWKTLLLIPILYCKSRFITDNSDNLKGLSQNHKIITTAQNSYAISGINREKFKAIKTDVVHRL